eukprot:TRINITY_DN3471_c1_g1_i1.p1 TRINITY_DN3471_c1_g1~~TRINITY_DN3471_c1_g1_i1.p1  ORF type:complete len:110 (+),score=19.85 TRINITY_DN3471_c1_g1_i1:100-429(+)
MEVMGHYHSERDLEFLGRPTLLSHCISHESFELINFEEEQERDRDCEANGMITSTGSGKTALSSDETDFLDILCDQCEYPECNSSHYDYGSDFEDVAQFLPTAVLKKPR